MTFQEEAAFIAAMQVAAEERPDLFTIKPEAVYFMGSYRLPVSLILAISDQLIEMEDAA
ncbi:MAG: hypothetical protein ACK5JT_13670 [Hyphomicrobiaceae bacterium]